MSDGTEAAVDGGEATEAASVATEQVAPESSGAAESITPEQVANYEQRLAALEGRSQDAPEGLDEALAPQQEATELTEAEIEAWVEQQLAGEDEGYDDFGYEGETDREAELGQRLAAIEEMLQNQAAERGRNELRELQDEFDDIMEPEVLGEVRDKLQMLVDETGREELATNAKIVRWAYQVVKAEQAGASDSSKPGSGSLEIQAGPSGQGEDSLDAQIISTLTDRKPKSIFTSG
jgi:hypothetical protein